MHFFQDKQILFFVLTWSDVCRKPPTMCTWLWSTATEETLQTILMVNIVLFSGNCYYQIIFQVPVPGFLLFLVSLLIFRFLALSVFIFDYFLLPLCSELFYLSAGVADPDPHESALI